MIWNWRESMHGIKIIVLGCPGSGKSTFSKKLQEITGLPLVHLDNIWWRSDRSHISREEFDQKLDEILQGDQWIVDGNYSRTYEVRFQSCDTIFFLDYSFDECMNGIRERVGKERTDIPWTEQSLDPELVKFVENYEKENRPVVLSLIEKYSEKNIFVFKSRFEADQWLRRLNSFVCKRRDCIMEHKIVALPKEEWKGVPILMRYTTNEYYDLEVSEGADGFETKMVKKKFETPVTHTPEEYDFPDSLYQDHWEKAEAYGIYREEDGKKILMACIEVCPEEWSNRLMVTELWVDDSLHRQGVGTALMNKAKEIAKEQNRRAIILETQSCNVRAIAFYRAQGFQLIGFDSCCYTNCDVERREIRFDFGYFLDRRRGRW